MTVFGCDEQMRDDISTSGKSCQELNLLGEESMKVKIDYDLCMGDRNCNKVCPEVFQYDEDQMVSRVLVDEIPKHLEARVRQAADECAPRAVIVEE